MIDVRARDTSGARNGLRFLLRGLSAALAILFVTSCGNDLFIAGTPIITLTVNHGQFTSYIVSIDELLMTRKDGTVIQVPIAFTSSNGTSEGIDLAQLTNTVQFLSAPAIQEGTYVSATLEVNYSAANINIDAGGEAGYTTLFDEIGGATPGEEQFTVYFDPSSPLVVGNQTGSLINFNIDLEASNTVDNSNGLPANVTIHPMVTASAVPVYDKPIYVRGLFVIADTNSGTFVMNTRPLHDMANQPTGAVTIVPNAQTYYNIDGLTYIGAAGIKQLDALKAETASLQIAALGAPGSGTIGNLGQDTPTFVATEVYAGSSLESTIQDRITGIVAGRSGETLTIVGASLVDRSGQAGFRQSIPVTLAPYTSPASPGTVVSVDGVASPSPKPIIDTISVGQYVEISGQVNPADANNGYVNPDNTFNPTGLDATFGQVRIKPTTLWTTLNSATTRLSAGVAGLDSILQAITQPPELRLHRRGNQHLGVELHHQHRLHGCECHGAGNPPERGRAYEPLRLRTARFHGEHHHNGHVASTATHHRMVGRWQPQSVYRHGRGWHIRQPAGRQLSCGSGPRHSRWTHDYGHREPAQSAPGLVGDRPGNLERPCCTEHVSVHDRECTERNLQL